MRRLGPIELSTLAVRVATLCGRRELAREVADRSSLFPLIQMHEAEADWFEPRVILNPECVLVGRRARIDSFTKVEGGLGVCIGAFTHVSSFCHINGGGGAVWIGNHVGIASGVKVVGGAQHDDVPSMSAASPEPLSRPRRSFCFIDDQAFLGTNAVVLSGVSIGRGAVVAAGSVVTRDVGPWEVAMGVPARVVSRRTPMPLPSA